MPNLYLTEPGSVLQKSDGRLRVMKGDKELLAIPTPQVDNVVVLAGANVTTPVLTFLLDRGIGLVFLAADGSFRGRLTADLSKNVALRRQQYRRADDPAFSLTVARAVVAGKLANCRVRCREMADGRDDPVDRAAVDELAQLMQRASLAENRAELMGIEGAGTRRYFEVVRHHIRPPWRFERRQRRPPPDPVNALISLLATFVHEACYGAAEAAGLDPFCGFLHEEQYGRASLALDLMEEFRPILVEATVLLLLNKRLLAPDAFVAVAGGGVHLKPEAMRVVVTHYHQRLRSLVQPSRLTPRVSYQQLLELQAQKMRAVIEGKTAVYEPFRAR